MSVQMAILRARFRIAGQWQRLTARGVPTPYEQLQAGDEHEPPRAVRRHHHCTAVEHGGARAVWLDRNHAPEGVLVFLHGGSYVSGPFLDQWQYLSRLCRRTGMAGLLVDYRLAPQHPFPAALEDALAVIDGATRERLLRPGAWSLLGDSAGGGLAVAVASRLRDGAGDPPAALVLCSPWLDLAVADPDARRLARVDAMLTLDGLARHAAAYAGDRPLDDPLLSPLHGDPHGLPPTMIHTGTRELFLPDVRTWERRCREAGVTVVSREQPGGFHGYVTAVASLPEARRAADEQAEFVVEAHALEGDRA
ncbi:alpha/beta hydrolase [Patulibacter defluvii]|uniref:alpha/beta hydrolase n=1 Tax=Patulibacter defluvii TaxID=3095358 RepID=UPI002A757690|nr:alpha/beta hydrolase [Patulibacter sp. DM4]